MDIIFFQNYRKAFLSEKCRTVALCCHKLLNQREKQTGTLFVGPGKTLNIILLKEGISVPDVLWVPSAALPLLRGQRMLVAYAVNVVPIHA